MSAATMTNSKNCHAGNKHYSRARQDARKATAYCKVCHDAGRPRHEYTSHFVKDKKGPDGKVVCPLLLNQECRYCHEKGHTPKECPEIKAKAERKREYEQRRRENRTRPDADGFRVSNGQRQNGSYRHPAPKTRAVHEALVSKLQPTNLFAALRESSSDEEESTQKDAFPALPSKPVQSVVAPTKSNLTGWAALAAKPAVQTKPIVPAQKPPTITRDAWEDDSVCSDASEGEEERAQRRAEWARECERMKGMSWADMCDSDDEDYTSDQDW